MTPATGSEYKGEDSRYHLRHEARSSGRAAVIAAHLGRAATILDVGCNRGVTSLYFLRTLPEAQVTGIEISRGTVAPELLQNDRFQFVEGNICELSLDRHFDAVFYGAVHHHIFRERGLSEAVRVWRTLAASCRDQLFFETGHLTEGGRWAWQRAIRRYFRTDEEHIFYMLRCIEDRIESFEIVGKYRIHGVRRWLIRIALKPPATENQEIEGDARMKLDLSRASLLVRSFGSRRQRLFAPAAPSADSPVCFYMVEGQGRRLFVKQALHSPSALQREFEIATDVNYDWAVRPLGRLQDGSIVFPWLDAPRLLDILPVHRRERQQLAAQLREIWAQCLRHHCKGQDTPLLPLQPGTTLADVVDLNPNNFLLEASADGGNLRLVDFEPQSNHYRWKNRIHISRMLMKLRVHRFRAMMLWILGIVQGSLHVLLYQWLPTEDRIRDRQPALASVALTTIRSWSGRVLVRLAPGLDEL